MLWLENFRWYRRLRGGRWAQVTGWFWGKRWVRMSRYSVERADEWCADGLRVSPLFAWYDLWVGAFWDRRERRLYVLPVPCLGVVLDFSGVWPAAGLRVHPRTRQL